MATGVGEPDPAGLFAICVEAGDDSGAEIDGLGLRFGVESDANNRIARADGCRCDELSIRCEVDEILRAIGRRIRESDRPALR